MKPLLEAKGLRHLYGGRCVLRVDELALGRGEVVALLGPNGAGKSTLLRLLSLMDRPSNGKIFFEGKPAFPFSPVSRRLALLPQEPYLLKRSVFENVAYGLKVRGIREGLKSRVFEALSWVGLSPTEFASRPWHALSGGEAQRVALAARLVFRPEVLLLDEPTASVDPQSAKLIREAILRARDSWGATLLIATHDWAWVGEFAQRWLYLFRGEIFEEAPPILIFGPFRKEETFWVKEFSDGKRLFLSPPREPGAEVALLSGEKVSLARGGAGENVLDFQVLSVIFKKASGELLVSLRREDLSLTFTLPSGVPCPRPGERLWLKFPREAKRWFSL